jgi:transcriptional regulator with XRE-family HTH domain
MRPAVHPEPEWAEFVAELGRNLQRERVSRGFSQERIAYSAGLSRYTYQKYEKGESRPGTPANPSLRALLSIAQALGTTIEEIVPAAIPDLKAR